MVTIEQSPISNATRHARCTSYRLCFCLVFVFFCSSCCSFLGWWIQLLVRMEFHFISIFFLVELWNNSKTTISTKTFNTKHGKWPSNLCAQCKGYGFEKIKKIELLIFVWDYKSINCERTFERASPFQTSVAQCRTEMAYLCRVCSNRESREQRTPIDIEIHSQYFNNIFAHMWHHLPHRVSPIQQIRSTMSHKNLNGKCDNGQWILSPRNDCSCIYDEYPFPIRKIATAT